MIETLSSGPLVVGPSGRLALWHLYIITEHNNINIHMLEIIQEHARIYFTLKFSMIMGNVILIY